MRLANLAALAAGIVFCSPGHAADLSMPLPQAPSLPQQGPSFFDGFYVRIDGGVGFNERPRLTTLPNPVGTAAGSLVDPGYNGVYSSSTYTSARLDATTFGGLGVGYQFTPWLRVDVTGEYRAPVDIKATNVLNDSGTTGPFGALASSHSAVSTFTGRLSSAVFLVNGYIDLGRYYGFTPFVGAGVGVASNYLSRLTDTGTYTTQIAGLPAFNVATDAFLPARSRTEFAYALMAGVAYDIAPNLKLEAGYRRLDMGGYASGTEHFNIPGGVLATSYYGQNRSFVSNEVRLGLRWNFSSVPSDQPLVQRY